MLVHIVSTINEGRCELTLWPMQETGSSTDFAHKIDSEFFFSVAVIVF